MKTGRAAAGGLIEEMVSMNAQSGPSGKVKKLLDAAVKEFNAALEAGRKKEALKPHPEVWKKAIKQATKVLELQPGSTLALYLRARAYYYAGMYEGTLADLEKLAQIGPYTSVGMEGLPPRRLRAMACIKLGRFQEAENDLLEQIADLERALAGIANSKEIVHNSDEFYWLLVCRNKGDERAAIREQFKTGSD
jgi:tetratricopeptide (TPR) repeat protein